MNKKACKAALEAYPEGKVCRSYFDSNEKRRKIFRQGYERAELDAKTAPFKSPFTGGIVTIEEEEETLNYRGEELTVNRKFYQCKDTGERFTDTKLDGDLMWALYRAYWEKKGFEHFYEIDNDMLINLIDAIDYSYLHIDGTYDDALSYPVIDKVNFIKKTLNKK